MDDIVMVPIPVSREAAAALSDGERRAQVGRLVSAMVRPSSPNEDPLAALIAEIKSDARSGQVSDAEIDAELDVYNAERRL
jgi:hypothetical protein